MIDVDRGQVVATHRMDEFLLSLDSKGFAATLNTLEDGFYQLEVWRMAVVGYRR